jgi:hypothetical protein
MLLSNYKIILYSDQNTAGLRNLCRTLDQGQFQYQWIGEGDHYAGHHSLIERVLTYLQSEPDDQPLVKLDAHDVLAYGTSSEMIDQWNRLLNEHPNHSLIVGSESLCTTYPIPLTYYAYHQINPQQHPRPYINSGCLWSTAKGLRDFYQWAQAYTDDQIALIKYADTYPDRVILDLKSQLVFNQTIIDGADFVTVDGQPRVYSSLTQTYPIFHHVPGRWWDLLYRMDRSGRHRLGQEYDSISLSNRLYYIGTKIKKTLPWMMV